MTYKQSVERFQDSINHALIMLQHDPHFVTLIELWKQGREQMIYDLCMEGMSQKDIDRLRGAIYFADEVLRNAQPKIQNGHGSRNASR